MCSIFHCIQNFFCLELQLTESHDEVCTLGLGFVRGCRRQREWISAYAADGMAELDKIRLQR